MLTLSNLTNKFLKLESAAITEIISDPSKFTDVAITVQRNCCADFIYEGALDMENPSTSLCSGEVTWIADLTTILDNELIIKEIKVMNILTGIVTSIDMASFQFLNSCYVSSGNVIDACASATTFKSTLTTWFTNNMQTSVGVDIVGNVLHFCTLPANIVPVSIVYTDSVNTEELELLFGSYNSDVAFVGANAIYISPSIISEDTTEFPDGVYKVTIRLNEPDGSYIQENNCFFLDVETKCLIAEKIQEFIDADELDTSLHMYYYALTSSNNCGCNCVDLCYLYSKIVTLLGTETTISTDGCGC